MIYKFTGVQTQFGFFDNKKSSLTNENDDLNKNFDQIADIIEKH